MGGSDREGATLERGAKEEAVPGARATVEEPTAILPDGTRIKPDSYSGGFHGTNIPPDVALKEGLPARRDDWRLLEHVQENPNSAFRGVTEVASDPINQGGAAYWPDEGGYVYEVKGVSTWDVNKALQGRVQTPGGFRGNLMQGENELAIPARVTPDKIKPWGIVKRAPSGRLYVELHKVL